MTKKDICDRALARIGSRVYESGSEQAKQCDLVYDASVRELVSRGRWSFAMRRVCVGGGVVNDEVVCLLPCDCLRLLDCSLRDWSLRGRAIVCDGCWGGGKIFITYLSSDLSEDDLEGAALFVDCLVLLVASKLAMPVAGSLGLGQALRQEFEVLFEVALTVDKVQDCSNDSGVVGVVGVRRRGARWGF